MQLPRMQNTFRVGSYCSFAEWKRNLFIFISCTYTWRCYEGICCRSVAPSSAINISFWRERVKIDTFLKEFLQRQENFLQKLPGALFPALQKRWRVRYWSQESNICPEEQFSCHWYIDILVQLQVVNAVTSSAFWDVIDTTFDMDRSRRISCPERYVRINRYCMGREVCKRYVTWSYRIHNMDCVCPYSSNLLHLSSKHLNFPVWPISDGGRSQRRRLSDADVSVL